MTERVQPIIVAAYRLAELADVLAHAQTIDFDPERDMPFTDVDAELKRMNPDPSKRASLAGTMLYSPSVNVGQAQQAIARLKKIEKLDVRRLIACIERQVEVHEQCQSDYRAIIADEQRRAAKAAEDADAMANDKLLARIEELEREIEKGGADNG